MLLSLSLSEFDRPVVAPPDSIIARVVEGEFIVGYFPGIFSPTFLTIQIRAVQGYDFGDPDVLH